MTDLEKAARMALDALGYYEVAGLATTRVAKSITALRQALEQPAQQEPIGYTDGINWQPRQSEMVVKIVRNKQPEHGFVHAIYTSPQRKSWVGLTREEKQHIIDANFGGSRADCMDEAERILRRKNT